MAKRDQLQQHLEGLFSDLSAEEPRVEQETAPQPGADDLLRLFGEAPDAPTPAPEPETHQMPEPESTLASAQPAVMVQPDASVPDSVPQVDAPGRVADEPAGEVTLPQIRRLRPTTAHKMFVAFLLVAFVPVLIILIFGSTLFVIIVALAIAGILALQLIQMSGWDSANQARVAGEVATASLEGATDAAEVADLAALEQSIAQLNRQASDLAASAEITRAVASSLDPQQVLQIAADATRTRFCLNNVTIYQADQDDATLAAVISSGEAAAEVVAKPQRWAIDDDSLVGAAYADAQAHFAANVPPGAYPLLSASRSALAVPLRIGGRRLGIMEMHSSVPDAFGDQEAQTYAHIADAVALALLNAERYGEHKRLVHQRDVTTRLADRITQETDLDDIVTVALRQLGATYQLSRATFCLGTEAELTAAGNGHRQEEP